MSTSAQDLNKGSPQSTLWLIDDDPALRLILADTFSEAQMNVVSFTQAKAAWTRLNDVLQSGDRSTLPDVILTDIRMPLMDGLSFSEWVNKTFPELPIIIMTAHSDLQSAVDSYQTGAFDYLPKPFDLDDAVATVKKAIKPRFTTSKPTSINSQAVISQDNEQVLDQNPINSNKDNKENNKNNGSDKVTNISPNQRVNNTVTSQIDTDSNSVNNATINNATSFKIGSKSKRKNSNRTHIDRANTIAATQPASSNSNPNGIIGQSVAMQTVFRAIGRLSHSPITVLITGESGTGKELVANALHQHSPRRNKPFIALNMAAIPHDLIESELFGHEKGAFTGASTMRQGRFEQANGGTLFLDEIGDMPFSTQTRLLRVLANGEFYRVGGQKPIKVDVRIIAATHQNLENLVKLGKFREDLFYRLNVIRLPLPPLRERREDIPALVTHFMRRAATEMSTEQKYIDPQALAIMQSFDWSGNVRQIENVCRWLTVMATGDTVLAEDLPPELLDFVHQPLDNNHNNHNNHSQSTQSIHSSPANRPVVAESIMHASTTSTTGSFNTNTYTDSPPSLVNEHENHRQLYNDQIANGPSSSQNAVLTSQSSNLNEVAAKPLWQQALAQWAQNALTNGESEILQLAAPEFERVLLKVALQHTHGRKGDAAVLLGWGRNTLTRKLKQLNLTEGN